MAARTLQALGLSMNDVSVDGGRNVFVATPARVLRDLVIELRNLDGVGIPPCSEVERVPEAVVGLDGVFANDVMRRVTVVAGSGGVVARL